MIEKTAERSADGKIVRVLERTLSPAEELVELTWARVKAGLLSRPELKEPVVRIGPLPAGADFDALVDALSARLALEGEAFSGAKWTRLKFERGA